MVQSLRCRESGRALTVQLMDDKPALQTEIAVKRDRIFQLRLMLQHAKPGQPSDIASVRSRLAAEVNQLNKILKSPSTRPRRANTRKPYTIAGLRKERS